MSSSTAEEKREAIVDGLRSRLQQMPDERFDDVSDPRAVGENMAVFVPESPGAFSKIIGPVYSTRALTSLWRVSREAVSKRARNGGLLVLKVEGENLFPVFQFDGAEVRQDVMAVVKAFGEHVDPFTIAQWLNTRQVSDGARRTPIEMLDSGAFNEVVSAARVASARWAA